MSLDIQKLLNVIEHRLDWGAPAEWLGRDFDELHRRILESTGVSLSPSTLKRVWGRAQYSHEPSGVTLDTLARFAGFEDYRGFKRGGVGGGANGMAAEGGVNGVAAVGAANKGPAEGVTNGGAAEGAAARRGAWPRIAALAAAALVIALVGVLAFKKRPKPLPAGPYGFSSKIVVTRGVPNSVIFSYSAPIPGTDSVFIQQSWDPRRREQVPAGAHQYTSIYYKPGFFRARLIVDTQEVLSHKLLIASDGWLGMVDNYDPVPVYLKPEEFLQKDRMSFPRGSKQNDPCAAPDRGGGARTPGRR